MLAGWDVSTSVIGVSLFGDDGKYIGSDHLDLRKCESFLEKCLLAYHFIQEYMNRQGVSSAAHYVEDKLGGFAMGKTMMQTLMKLAGFNAVVSWQIYQACGNVSHIHPSRVKSVVRKDGLVIPKGGDKKALTLDWVSKREPTFRVDLNRNGKPQPWCFDRADSYIVGLAGMKAAANCSVSES